MSDDKEARDGEAPDPKDETGTKESEAASDEQAKSEAASDEQAKSEAASDEQPAADPKKDAEREAPPSKRTKQETWTNTLLWAAGILAVLSIELYVYGHDGDIEVCVGIEELTDFSLRTVPRSKENATKHPFCAKRVNLGMWSNSEKLSEEALKEACGAASRIVGAEHRQKCLRRDDPWSRFVEKKQIAPWDPRLYRRLLWLD